MIQHSDIEILELVAKMLELAVGDWLSSSEALQMMIIREHENNPFLSSANSR